MDKKLTSILNEASFAPKRVYALYFYYEQQIDSLYTNSTDKEEAYKLLSQILDIKIEDTHVCSNRY